MKTKLGSKPEPVPCPKPVELVPYCQWRRDTECISRIRRDICVGRREDDGNGTGYYPQR